MLILQNFSEPNTTFMPAVLHKNKGNGWQVVYYALNPQSKKLERVRIKINKILSRYQNKKEAKLHSINILDNINQKLKCGWSPFFEGENARLYEKLPDVLQKYITESQKDKRENTLRSYKSFANMLNSWVSKNCKDIYCSLFNHYYAIQYMDYLYNERDVIAATYNNQLKMARAFFNWAKEKCYVKENPFERIKTKRKQDKKRTIIPPETRKKVTDYLQAQNDTQFELVCKVPHIERVTLNAVTEKRVN